MERLATRAPFVTSCTRFFVWCQRTLSEQRVGRGVAGSVAVDAEHASGTCSGSAGSDVACAGC